MLTRTTSHSHIHHIHTELHTYDQPFTQNSTRTTSHSHIHPELHTYAQPFPRYSTSPSNAYNQPFPTQLTSIQHVPTNPPHTTHLYPTRTNQPFPTQLHTYDQPFLQTSTSLSNTYQPTLPTQLHTTLVVWGGLLGTCGVRLAQHHW